MYYGKGYVTGTANACSKRKRVRLRLRVRVRIDDEVTWTVNAGGSRKAAWMTWTCGRSRPQYTDTDYVSVIARAEGMPWSAGPDAATASGGGLQLSLRVSPRGMAAACSSEPRLATHRPRRPRREPSSDTRPHGGRVREDGAHARSGHVSVFRIRKRIP